MLALVAPVASSTTATCCDGETRLTVSHPASARAKAAPADRYPNWREIISPLMNSQLRWPRAPDLVGSGWPWPRTLADLCPQTAMAPSLARRAAVCVCLFPKRGGAPPRGGGGPLVGSPKRKGKGQKKPQPRGFGLGGQ